MKKSDEFDDWQFNAGNCFIRLLPTNFFLSAYFLLKLHAINLSKFYLSDFLECSIMAFITFCYTFPMPKFHALH